MTLFTLIDHGSGDVIAVGQTAKQAAEAVLTDDGREFELQPEADGEGWRVWSRQQVANRPWAATRHFSLEPDRDTAWADIAQRVVDDHDRSARGSYGPDIVSDEAYAASIKDQLADLVHEDEDEAARLRPILTAQLAAVCGGSE